MFKSRTYYGKNDKFVYVVRKAFHMEAIVLKLSNNKLAFPPLLHVPCWMFEAG